MTEHLDRHWSEKNTGQVVTDVQRQLFHAAHRWMAATIDGKIEATGAVFEAKFMLPWNFYEEGAAKHMAQRQHNMWVAASRTAVLSIITGGGKWVDMTIFADPLYQHLLLTAERNSGAASRAASPLASSALSRRGPGLRSNRRHERLECVSRVCLPLPADPRCRA